jgi:hypothetical protein
MIAALSLMSISPNLDLGLKRIEREVVREEKTAKNPAPALKSKPTMGLLQIAQMSPKVQESQLLWKEFHSQMRGN